MSNLIKGVIAHHTPWSTHTQEEETIQGVYMGEGETLGGHLKFLSTADRSDLESRTRLNNK